MTIKSNATGTGTSAAAAGALIGGVSNGVTAGAGSSSQANAALLPRVSNHVITTGASNSGVILPPGTTSTDALAAGDWMSVANYTGNTIIVYPPTGGKLNNGSTNAGLSLTNGKTADFTCIDGTGFFYVLTA
jgi:hypothetical protein